MKSYDVGDMARIQATFTNTAGAATDPTTITLRIRKPDGTILTKTYAAAEIIRSGAGVYYFDLEFTASGTWAWRWEGTGTVVTAEESAARVRRRRVPAS